METKTTNTVYNKILRLIDQLPEEDVNKLIAALRSGKKFREKPQSINKLILNAPTWTDDEYNDYVNVRKHFNQSRLA